MSKVSVLEYLKKPSKSKEHFQIPLAEDELQVIYQENPKIINKLNDLNMIQEFEGEQDADTSPFCLLLLKKGFLSNIERKTLLNPKEEIDRQLGFLQILCNLFGQDVKLNPQTLSLLIQEITGQAVDKETLEDPELPKEAKEELGSLLVVYKEMPTEEKQKLARTLGAKENETLLKGLLNIDSEDKEDKLIDEITKFFSLRYQTLNLTREEVAVFPVTLLQKIALFIQYENAKWEDKIVPKATQQYIRSSGG